MEINRGRASPVPLPLPSSPLSSPSRPLPPFRKTAFACIVRVPSPLFSPRRSSTSSLCARICRRGRKLVFKMSTGKLGNMIHQPILEEGIFRFDCSSDDRSSAFPSLSFVDSRKRDSPITSNAAPLYVPTFEKNLIDLVGSKRAAQTKSKGLRWKEGSHINRSLLTLTQVIRKPRRRIGRCKTEEHCR